MHAFLAVLPLLAGAPSDAPRPTPVACAVMASGRCVYDGPVAGNGGNGGNASVNIIVVPQAGNGGGGGNASGGAQSAQPAREAIASRCSLTIAGRTEVEAVGCRYTSSPTRFSVQAPSANGHHVYVATVDIAPDRTGVGSLSGGATQAVRSLGPMTRDGACWRTPTTALCAWK